MSQNQHCQVRKNYRNNFQVSISNKEIESQLYTKRAINMIQIYISFLHICVREQSLANSARQLALVFNQGVSLI
jgi:hypothetical protein